MTTAAAPASSYDISLYLSYSSILDAIIGRPSAVQRLRFNAIVATLQRLNAISGLRHLNKRLLNGQLKSHEVEEFISTKGKSIAAIPDIREALSLLHCICLVKEKDWPRAIDCLKPLSRARRNDVKLAAMIIETLAFERQGGTSEEFEDRLDAISKHYGIKSIIKNLLLSMTLSNIDDGIRAIAAGKDSLAFAGRVAMLDKIGKKHGEDIVEPAFRTGKAWLKENIDAVWDSFVIPSRLNFKTKQLLTNRMKLSIRKLISETGGKASVYIDEFEDSTMTTIQTQSLDFTNRKIEDAELDYVREWNFCISPPPIKTYKIKVKLNNIGYLPPRIHFDQDYIPLYDD